ncbi:hypothetical protein L1F30_08390 [Simiduia sp. 21SJ11W-1]|uniref:hypothetical protein n=1 Tax=Simiduia sp. 21SJ11W-1 TaxID=2909669 RepID=UPI00209D2A9A|nr:hypothetical protein [Simiduia sp. 21SJ11W-1]UTA49542.1 hypothetical protein L1F30_08390 [Simiduia sp. 21SJ11W-1]
MTSSTPKIVVLGDSHTRALRKAIEGNDSNIEVRWLRKENSAQSQGDTSLDEANDVIDSLSNDDFLFLSFAGTQHNIYGLLKHETAFEVVHNDDFSGGLASHTEVIPQAVLIDFFLEKTLKNKTVSQFVDRANCNVFHLSTPPPKGDNDFIMRKISKYRDQLVSEVGLNSAKLRLQLWELEMIALQKACKSWKIKFLPAPANGLDANGFLSVDCYADDATHANVVYAKLVLEQLRAMSNKMPQ